MRWRASTETQFALTKGNKERIVTYSSTNGHLRSNSFNSGEKQLLSERKVYYVSFFTTHVTITGRFW